MTVNCHSLPSDFHPEGNSLYSLIHSTFHLTTIYLATSYALSTVLTSVDKMVDKGDIDLAFMIFFFPSNYFCDKLSVIVINAMIDMSKML